MSTNQMLRLTACPRLSSMFSARRPKVSGTHQLRSPLSVAVPPAETAAEEDVAASHRSVSFSVSEVSRPPFLLTSRDCTSSSHQQGAKMTPSGLRVLQWGPSAAPCAPHPQRPRNTPIWPTSASVFVSMETPANLLLALPVHILHLKFFSFRPRPPRPPPPHPRPASLSGGGGARGARGR